VALVDGGLPEAEEEEQEFDFPEVSELECVRVAPVEWIQALSNAFQGRGIPHRVGPATPEDAPEGQRAEIFGNAPLFGIYVLADNAAAAAEIDAATAARILPEEAPALAEGEEESCPACGTVLTRDATECSDCGLPFG
jgi:hypothetical protein